MNRIHNIIFDFGGVIIQIDYRLTIDAFKKLGIRNFDEQYSKLQQTTLFDSLEKGLITAAEFRNRLKSLADSTVTDEEVDAAWNALLIDLPAENINFLQDLRKKYPLFLLSNTNAIHEHAFMEMIKKKFGSDVLAECFDRIYFSHHLHLRKPDPEIFRHVIKENGLIPEETLFVDDSFQHIEGARQANLLTYYFDKGKTLWDVEQFLLTS